jgi:hypothetical protein
LWNRVEALASGLTDKRRMPISSKGLGPRSRSCRMVDVHNAPPIGNHHPTNRDRVSNRTGGYSRNCDNRAKPESFVADAETIA